MVSSRKRRLAKGRRSTRTRHSSATNRSVPTVSAPSVVLEKKYGRHGLVHLAEMISQEDDDWEQVPALWKWDSDSDDSEFEVDVSEVPQLSHRRWNCNDDDSIISSSSECSEMSDLMDYDDSKDFDSNNGDMDDSDDDTVYFDDEMPRLVPRDSYENVEKAMQDVDDLLFLQEQASKLRSDRWDHERLDWDSHVAQLEHEGSFVNEYMMSREAHSKLVHILQPVLQRAEYNSRCSEPITVEHIIAIALRVLSGGRTKDNRGIIGTSLSAGYNAVNDFIDAVNESDELAIRLPSCPQEWDDIRRGFMMKSSHHIMQGCVGAIDGYFQRTSRPYGVPNILAYYSGHYESYGVNCIACALSDLQFCYFGVMSPGSTNYNISYPRAEDLKYAFDHLPKGLYGVADAAFTLSENLLIPYTGAERFDAANDAFNYYLSQMRIRVEMAFGRLINKFGILDGKIKGSLDRVTAVLTACTRLHNFIIREDGLGGKNYSSVQEEMDGLEIQPNPMAPLGMSFLPVVPDDSFEEYTGISFTRQAIRDHLHNYELYRPLHNIERKQREVGYFLSPGTGHYITREYVSPM